MFQQVIIKRKSWGQAENSGKGFWDPCCNTREQNKKEVPLLAPGGRGRGWLLKWKEGKGAWVGWWASWRKVWVSLPPWLCHVGLLSSSYSCTRSLQNGSLWPFCILFIIAPAAHSCSYFWSFLVSLCLLLQERSVQVQSLHMIPRSNLSHFKP